MKPKNELTPEQSLALCRKLSGRTEKKPLKYRNTPTTVDGIRFDSKKEAEHYKLLKAWRDDPSANGDGRFFLRQVPFHLPGKTTYRADFLVFSLPYSVEVHEVKSPITRKKDSYRIKRRLWEETYGGKGIQFREI